MREIPAASWTRLRLSLAALLVIGGLVAAACAPAAPPQPAKPAAPAAPAPAPAAPAKQEPAKQEAKPAAAPAKPAAQPAKPAAAAPEVAIAVIAPLSGAWARQGELIRMGAEMAADEINQQGGIKSLGGAKVVLKIADAGDSAEKAKSAAQRLLAQEKNLVGGTGAWLSSFTLSLTEVTEREQMPWVTLSYSDQITDRGFKYVFQTSPTAGAQAQESLPVILKMAETATGKKPTKVGVISDNSASPVSFLKPMRDGGFAKVGLQVLQDDVFTPPLSDATPMVQKIRNTRPDFVILYPTATPDVKLLLEKINEFGLGKGNIPLIGNGAQYGTPEILKAIGPDLLEGFMAIVGNWPVKGTEQIVARFKQRTREPWMGQDSISTYGEVWIIKEALEKAGTTDRVKVADAIRGMNLTSGPAADAFPGRTVKWDAKGRRVGYTIPIYQWQKGLPVTVYPPEAALAQPLWPKQ